MRPPDISSSCVLDNTSKQVHTCTPDTPISVMSSVNTPGSLSMVVQLSLPDIVRTYLLSTEGRLYHTELSLAPRLSAFQLGQTPSGQQGMLAKVEAAGKTGHTC